MPRHDPATPLPNALHEAYVQQRARGMGPTEAAKAVGLDPFRPVERLSTFRDRLTLLQLQLQAAGEDSTLTLKWLVSERKRALQLALAGNQLRTADTILSKLEDLYAKHPELRGETTKASAPAAAPTDLATKRAAREARLSAVSEAANE